MKYKFCSIRITVTKYDITFAIKGGGSHPSTPRGYATAVVTFSAKYQCRYRRYF